MPTRKKPATPKSAVIARLQNGDGDGGNDCDPDDRAVAGISGPTTIAVNQVVHLHGTAEEVIINRLCHLQSIRRLIPGSCFIDPLGEDAEVMLDIEVAGAVAPDARIVVYFAPNSDRGFIDAINAAVHDNVHNPSVISISWGGPESAWSAQSMRTMDNVFQAAATLGVTICVASGDDGSADEDHDGVAHVDFPASSPFALACGGTTLLTSGGAIPAK